MLEVGWTEMLVIAIVMIVVVGPKDLPNMLRTFGRFAAKARGMAGDFQRQFNEALKEAELDDVKKSVDSLRDLHPAAQIRKQLNPFEKAAADVRAGVESATKPKPAEPPKVESADAPAQAAEPLKNGAADIPGVNGPDTMPPPVAFPAMTDASVVAAGATSSASAKGKKTGAVQRAPASNDAKAPARKAAAPTPTRVASKPTPKAAPAETASVKASSTASSAKAATAKPAAAGATPAKAVSAKPSPAKPAPAKTAGKPAAAKPAAAKAAPPKKTTRAK